MPGTIETTGYARDVSIIAESIVQGLPTTVELDQAIADLCRDYGETSIGAVASVYRDILTEVARWTRETMAPEDINA
jgi:hypothetical protein